MNSSGVKWIISQSAARPEKYCCASALPLFAFVKAIPGAPAVRDRIVTSSLIKSNQYCALPPRVSCQLLYARRSLLTLSSDASKGGSPIGCRGDLTHGSPEPAPSGSDEVTETNASSRSRQVTWTISKVGACRSSHSAASQN